MNIYDIPCPECRASIVSTAKLKDDTQAITTCAAGHKFTRAQAYASHQKKEALATYYDNMSDLMGPRLKIEASQRLQATADPVQAALTIALRVRRAEINAGTGFSKARMVLTLGHKYGFDRPTAEAAVARLISVGLGGGRLKAAARLRASLEHQLMARTTPITRAAEKGIKEICHQMAIRGYAPHTTCNRAYYTTTFTKEGEDGNIQSFQLYGWNGNGRYGLEKSVFEFYDDSMGEKPVVNIGAINEENVNLVRQEKVVHEVLDYIKKHCEA